MKRRVQIPVIFLLSAILLYGCENNTSMLETEISETSTPVSMTASPEPIATATIKPTQTMVATRILPTGTPTDTTGLLDILQIVAVSDAPVYSYEIVQTYPHDRTAFTQGLIYQEGYLYESTGRYEQSSLRKIDLNSGQIIQKVDLSPTVFGEGLTEFNDKLLQLTWKSGTGFVYDIDSLLYLKDFHYSSEGWGLTSDGQYVIMSNGSAELIYLEPEYLTEDHRILVNDNGTPINLLNELEYLDGSILANIWKSDYIADIDAETGLVKRWIDLYGLLHGEDMTSPVDVLNGIAINQQTGNLLVTGKLWPKLFEIKLVEK